MALIKQLLSLYILLLLVGGNAVLTEAVGETTPAPTPPAPGETTPAPTPPAPGETTPAPTPPAPGETTPAPTPPAPGETTPAPTPPAPGETTPAPTPPAPGETTPAPTPPAPGETTPAPTPPAPGETTPAPTPPAPGETTPAPTPPAPGETTPAPTPPAPGETTPAPTPPAPGETTPAPTPPAPGETTPAPTPPAPGGTTPAPTTLAPGPCASNPCPLGSTCQDLLNTYTCVCRPGLFYDEVQKICYLAKTFPTELKLVKLFENGMEDKNSLIFQKTAEEILTSLQAAFMKPAYLGSTVLSLKKGSVIADVENFFSPSSKVTANIVMEQLNDAINKPGLLSNAEVTYNNICSRGFCHDESTKCDPGSGLASCTCKEGYIKIMQTNQACAACPSGQKAVNQEECKLCDFGFSGFNCEDPYLLILVVLACVLGTLFLGTLTGAIVLYTRSKKMTKTPEKLPANGNLEFTKPAGIPRIPRVNPNSGWQPNNLEMTDSGSRHALVTKDRTETTAMWNYDYPEDTRTYKSQTPSRTGYAAAGAYNGSRVTRNPYNDAYDDKIRRY